MCGILPSTTDYRQPQSRRQHAADRLTTSYAALPPLLNHPWRSVRLSTPPAGACHRLPTAAPTFGRCPVCRLPGRPLLACRELREGQELDLQWHLRPVLVATGQGSRSRSATAMHRPSPSDSDPGWALPRAVEHLDHRGHGDDRDRQYLVEDHRHIGCIFVGCSTYGTWTPSYSGT